MGPWTITAGSFGALLAVFLSGAPVFIAFLAVNIIGVLVFLGPPAFGLVANSIFDMTNNANFAAVPLFVLLGELLFRSGSIDMLMRSVDNLVGRMRGRQYVVCISLSTIFGALSGSAIGVAAMLSRSLFPAMTANGYDRKLSTGAILAGASLAPIIPPSILAIIVATLAEVSVAQLLIAGILPGLLLSVLFIGYLLIRVMVDRSLAPDIQAETVQSGWRDKLQAVGNMMPFTIIIFSVMGLILLGVATPSESAAAGVMGALLTAGLTGKLNWRMIVEATASAAFITSMILVIIASANMFGQLLALTGSTRAIVQSITSLDLNTYVLLFLLMLIPFAMCLFLDQIALLLIIVPVYQPLIASVGFDPIWFWLLMLMNMTLGGITPPVGYTMFAFKGGAPQMPLSEIYAAAWPFVGLFILALFLIAVFPGIATYLPRMI